MSKSLKLRISLSERNKIFNLYLSSYRRLGSRLFSNTNLVVLPERLIEGSVVGGIDYGSSEDRYKGYILDIEGDGYSDFVGLRVSLIPHTGYNMFLDGLEHAVKVHSINDILTVDSSFGCRINKSNIKR